MKKVLFLLLLVTGASRACLATDYNSEELLSLIKLSQEAATPANITSMLGKPSKVEDDKKRTVWYYDHGNSSLVISWNKKSSQLEKFSFSDDLVEKSVFDIRTSKRLQSGVTSLTDAFKILGTPMDMTVKEMTQELHYSYQNKILRLFFRNKTLVDYTLY